MKALLLALTLNSSIAQAKTPSLQIHPYTMENLRLDSPSVALFVPYPGARFGGSCGIEIRSRGVLDMSSGLEIIGQQYSRVSVTSRKNSLRIRFPNFTGGLYIYGVTLKTVSGETLAEYFGDYTAVALAIACD